jgi:hypothetical protein
VLYLRRISSILHFDDMNSSTLPKKQLSISLNREFYEELNLIPARRSTGKTFKRNSDQYQLLLEDSQKSAKIKSKISLGQKLGTFQKNLVEKIRTFFSNLISTIANLPVIRDVLDICKFLFSPRNSRCRRYNKF